MIPGSGFPLNRAARAAHGPKYTPGPTSRRRGKQGVRPDEDITSLSIRVHAARIANVAAEAAELLEDALPAMTSEARALLLGGLAALLPALEAHKASLLQLIREARKAPPADWTPRTN